ncbi:MAG TPA: hypothetical protein VFY14_16820 [Streptomyces sp.]|nr:hypothetical protein [Streptomyces sp.]
MRGHNSAPPGTPGSARTAEAEPPAAPTAASFAASALQSVSRQSRKGVCREELAAVAATAMCAWPGRPEAP